MQQPTVILPILDKELNYLEKHGVEFSTVSHDFNGDPCYETLEVPAEPHNLIKLQGADRKFAADYLKNNK